MTHIIYPSPGSYNDFCARNPELDQRLRVQHLSIEMTLWRGTNPDIDLDKARLTPTEAMLRHQIDGAIARGEKVLELAMWPKVGEYEIPDIAAPKQAA